MQIISTEIICMKYQNLFYGENKENISMSSAENVTKSAKC